jgi:uncharacterized coiled-coil DUF342 family protein
MNDDADWIRGRVMALTAEVERLKQRDRDLRELIRGTRDELVEQIRSIKDGLDDWRETTEVKALRRAELERLRARADDADQAEYKVQSIRAKARRNVTLLAPAIAGALYALAELAKYLVHR